METKPNDCIEVKKVYFVETVRVRVKEERYLEAGGDKLRKLRGFRLFIKDGFIVLEDQDGKDKDVIKYTFVPLSNVKYFIPLDYKG